MLLVPHELQTPDDENGKLPWQRGLGRVVSAMDFHAMHVEPGLVTDRQGNPILPDGYYAISSRSTAGSGRRIGTIVPGLPPE